MPLPLATFFLFLLSASLFLWAGTRWAAMGPRVLARLGGRAVVRRSTPALPRMGWKDLLVRVSRMASSAAASGALRKRMVRAGFFAPAAAEWFRGAQVVCGLALGLVTLPTAGFAFDGPAVLATVMGACLLGFRCPSLYVAHRRSTRVRELQRTLPNAVDLLIVCIESGLGLDQALRTVARELGDAHPEISRELNLLTGEMSAGKTRVEALRQLSERTAIDDIRELVSALIQADRFGTSICQTLRTRSEFMRVQARQRAEEKAAKLGVKLIFPIFFCVLPTLFVLTLGPAIFQLVKELLPVINSM